MSQISEESRAYWRPIVAAMAPMTSEEIADIAQFCGASKLAAHPAQTATDHSGSTRHCVSLTTSWPFTLASAEAHAISFGSALAVVALAVNAATDTTTAPAARRICL